MNNRNVKAKAAGLFALLLLAVSFISAEGVAEDLDGKLPDTTGTMEEYGEADDGAAGAAENPARGRFAQRDQLRKYGSGNGVLIADVLLGSPADAAGLMRGDSILSVDGTGISNFNEILQVLDGYEHGEEITLTIMRADEELTVPLTLETRVGYPLIGIVANDSTYMPQRGMMRESLRDEAPRMERELPEIGRMFNIPEVLLQALEDGNGAVVQSVMEGGPAVTAGVEEGMVILQVDGTDVAEGDLATLIRSYDPGDTVVLSVATLDGESLEISVELGENDQKPLLGVTYIPVPAIAENGLFPGMGGMFFSNPWMNRGADDQPRFLIPDMHNN